MPTWSATAVNPLPGEPAFSPEAVEMDDVATLGLGSELATAPSSAPGRPTEDHLADRPGGRSR